MNRDDRHQLYEKLYFHELDRRDKISSRLSLPFAVIVATVGLQSFMLNAAAKPYDELLSSAFWALFISSVVALAAGVWFFRKAWFGHTDKLLPTASAIEAYQAELIKTYKDYQDQDSLVSNHFDDFLFDYYMQFSSDNAINNDRRSYNIYRSTVALTTAILLAFAAVVPFFIGNLEHQG